MQCKFAVLIVVLSLGAFAPTAQSTAVSPVQKVIMLIDDMAGKVTRDKDLAAAEFTEKMKFYDDETTKKGYAMKDSKKNIEKLSAVIESESAKADELDARVSDLSTQISASETELEGEVKMRAKEHADFVVVEKELVQTVQTLDGAKKTLEKTFSLAQLTPEAKNAFKGVLDGLGSLVDASFVTHAQREKVQAFLQAQEDSDDASRGGGGEAIMQTVEEMIEKAEGTLSDTRNEENGKSHAHMMLKSGMENEIKGFKEELAESTHGKQVSVEVKAQAVKDLAVEKKTLAGDTTYTQDMHHDCLMEAQEWEVDARDAHAELKALSTAKDLLAKKFSALVQTQMSHKMTLKATFSSKNEGNKAQALRLIQELGRSLHSTSLVSLAYRAAADPFVKIRGMVEDMIAKLMQEAAEEADAKAFCDKEMGESTKSKEDKQGKIDKLTARIEKGDSAVAELTEQVTVLSKELAEISAAVKEATEIRNSEKTEFVKSEQDFSESQEACAAALEVLREYYEGASLVQVAATSRSKMNTEGDGSGILGLLEVAESDFAKLLGDVRSKESVAADEYAKMMQDSKLETATKEMEVKGKESELKSLQTSLSDYASDKEGLDSELQAVLDYLDKLKPKCETKVPSYAEIKAKREKEIDGLKEALKILSQ